MDAFSASKRKKEFGLAYRQGPLIRRCLISDKTRTKSWLSSRADPPLFFRGVGLLVLSLMGYD